MDALRKAASALTGHGHQDSNNQQSRPAPQTSHSSRSMGSNSGYPKGFPTPESHEPYHMTTPIVTDVHTGDEMRPHASKMGRGLTECPCGGNAGACACDPGKCACKGCSMKNGHNPMAGKWAHGPEHGKGAVLKEDGMARGMGSEGMMKEGMKGKKGIELNK